MIRINFNDNLSFLGGKFKAKITDKIGVKYECHPQYASLSPMQTYLISEKFTVGNREVTIAAVSDSDFYNLMWTCLNNACNWDDLNEKQQEELANTMLRVVEYFMFANFTDDTPILTTNNHDAYDLFKALMVIEKDFTIDNGGTSVDAARKWGIDNFMNAIILEQCHMLRNFILSHYEDHYTLFDETILIASGWQYSDKQLYWDVIVYNHHQQFVRYMWRYSTEPAISLLLMLFVDKIKMTNKKNETSRWDDYTSDGFSPYNIGIVLDMARVTYDKMREKADAEINFVDFISQLIVNIKHYCTDAQYTALYNVLHTHDLQPGKVVCDYNGTQITLSENVFMRCTDMISLNIDLFYDSKSSKDHTKIPNQMLYDNHKEIGIPSWDRQVVFSTIQTTNGEWV